MRFSARRTEETLAKVKTQSAEIALVVHFVHLAATPHNNYLLDEVARCKGVELHRHYLCSPQSVPGRP